MNKFDRQYELSIDLIGGDTLIINPLLTIDFEITRNTLSSVNDATIHIYNLSEDHRNLIRRDIWKDYGVNTRKITFKAGYGQNLAVVAEGFIRQAFSVRQGTDYKTTIHSFDAGWAFTNARSKGSFPKGTTKQSVMNSLAKNLAEYGVKKGAITQIDGKLARGNAIDGPTLKLVSDVAGDKEVFVDNGKLNVLKTNEAIGSDDAFVISSETGLLGTPLREKAMITFDMIFEPRLQIAYLVQLEVKTDQNFNGAHKIYSISHRGRISGASAGQALTTVGLLSGTFSLVESGGN